MIKVNQVEKNVKRLVQNHDEANFIYDLLLAYGRPKATINRLKNGNLNLSSTPGEVSWKKQLFFKIEHHLDLHQTISSISKQIKDKQRFIIVTDFKTFLASDTKTNESLDINFEDFPMHYDFFLPWAGIEKQTYDDENIADIKAAQEMGKLFDKIKKDNPDNSKETEHSINIFLSRILFCLFAEDTNIFLKNQFISTISSHSHSDGSDCEKLITELFKTLNTPEDKRVNIPEYLNNFPYVNGDLFNERYLVPKITSKTRSLIIKSGQLDWSAINPDIFGSMLQAISNAEQRRHLGIHYTSVSNIMKLIKPLFLDELYQEYEASFGNKKKLLKLVNRLSKIKIFDPACGSGNFLIISMKELKRLETEIFKQLNSFNFSEIRPSQFYGIELDDFAHEIAKLSLWLTEHQLNIEFFNEFNQVSPTLPLKKSGVIYSGNAISSDWSSVCKIDNDNDDEIYIIGNPPYSGSSYQSKEQKNDLALVCQDKLDNFKNLDYVSCWFIKAAEYIKGNLKCKFAFVTTNSITQGELVSLLWPYVFKNGIEIFFAYKTFKWTNNASKKAAVLVNIIGLSNTINKGKYIFNENEKRKVNYINPYLTSSKISFLSRRSSPISRLPIMLKGNQATDDGNFILSESEKDELLIKHPETSRYVKKYIGSQEFIKGIQRWCLWIPDNEYEVIKKIPFINERIDKIRIFRLASKAPTTREAAKRSHRFIQIQHEPSSAIIIPTVSSEKRSYIPIGFVQDDTLVNAQSYVVYGQHTYLFSILSSRMHMTWVKTVAGRLKSDFRYSSALCYFSYPFPLINSRQTDELETLAYDILGVRERYPDKTIAEMYDAATMPEDLKEAHSKNDSVIESLYRSKPFEDDDDRLEYLFNMYKKMSSVKN